MGINNQETFLELVAAYHENPDKFVFFVGAGLSQPLFPSWQEFLRELVRQAKEAGLTFDESELLGYIEKGENYLDIAEHCCDVMGSYRYRDLMEKVFDREFSESEIPEGYKALIELSPKTIITTNYDRIPDVAGKGKYRIITNRNAPEAARFFADNKNIVFKIHGDLTDQSSIVLTTADYQKMIANNQSTRNLLNSLLSTKVLIFVGFSLSDPHIGLVLENIKVINNGLSLSHYVLLNEDSKFKISSFENRFGVKVISYTPSDKSHPEVLELLRALNHEAASVPEQLEASHTVNINSPEQLIKHVESRLVDVIVGSAFSVFYNRGELCLSFTPSGETKSEIQKEILSILRIFGFESKLVNKLHIYVAMRTLPLVNFDKSQAIMIKATINYSNANRYANKEITTSTIWKLMCFYMPPGLSDVFQTETEVEFPISMGIVGEGL